MLQKERRIDGGRVEIYREMQMRSSDAARGADLADQGAGGHGLRDARVAGFQVSVEREQPLPVVEDDAAAQEEVVAAVDDASRICGDHRRACGRRDVHSGVGVPRLVVEVAAQAEGVQALPGCGLKHGERRRRGVGERAQHVVQVRPLAFVPREILRRKIHLVRRHLEALRAVRLGYDIDHEPLVPAAGMLRLHPQPRARLRGQRDADERDPRVAFAHHQHAAAAEARSRRSLGGAEADSRDAAGHRRRTRDGCGPYAGQPCRRSERGRERQEQATPVHHRDSSSRGEQTPQAYSHPTCPSTGGPGGDRIMNKLSSVCARLLVPAFIVAGIIAAPAMAQEKKAGKSAGNERVQKALIDNGKVRVTETTFKPGQVSPSIERPYRITRVLSGGETLRTHADGKTEKRVFKTGEVFEAGPDKAYSTKNVGKTNIVLYTVTPKQAK